MGLRVQPQQEHFAIFTLIYVWKQYFQLLKWHKIVTYIIILTLVINSLPRLTNVALKDHPHHLTKYEEARGQKSQFQTFNELGKIWRCNLGFSKIHIFFSFMNWKKLGSIHSTAQDQNFKIQILNPWMNWETFCLNLSFTVENKMENSHKNIWSHFKLNINDWDP